MCEIAPSPPSKYRKRGAVVAKSERTLMIEQAIDTDFNKHGSFGCAEVTIGWYGKERVDYMAIDCKGTIRCFEIKVSKSDFYSANHKSFAGHMNYYVLPVELYKEVKQDIEKGIGVYLYTGQRTCFIEKKATRKKVKNEDVLKMSLIRSLAREVKKFKRTESEETI